MSLVLSLFPGIGLLDRAFEEEGFCVVRGPDLLWGGDIRSFHPPAGVFDGVIGGPPCQAHSVMGGLNPLAGRHGDQIPEFVRCVKAASPSWFLMENVPGAPAPAAHGYAVSYRQLNNRWMGEEQSRLRGFWFGVPGAYGTRLPVLESALLNPTHELCVLAGHGPALGQRTRGIAGRAWPEMARLQGLPPEWIALMRIEAPFTVHGMKRVIGNGVPLPMGRAIARAVKAAMQECAA